MDAASRQAGGATSPDRRAAPTVRPARILPAGHPAVRWAAMHSPSGVLPRPSRPARPAPLRRSLGRHLEHGFRADIEGLRALAVVAVVLYHGRLLGLRGGFVGVDVFFVVSGFLITRLVLGELARSERLGLAAFWGRRARRLLPASALVVVATAAGAHLLLPPLTQRTVVTDVVAAATFTSNLAFADRLGSYFGAQLAESAPSPLLHFWSLAVEEQFYLCWPPLLVLLARRPRQYRRLVLTAVLALGAVGFALAAWLTPRSPSWAFFLLPTRMGELLAGALLALLGTQVHVVPPRVRATLAWIGLAVIVVACVRLDDAVPWPGTAVLVPVVATMAVIVGGSVAGVGWSPVVALGHPVLQWIGAHSYALYLWHWPVMVLAAARGPLDAPEAVVAIVVALALAALSVRLVEDPVRHSTWLAARPRRSLALGAVLVLVMLTGAWAMARAVPPLDGGVVAAAPTLGPPAPIAPVPAATTPPTTVGAPPAGTATPAPTTVPAAVSLAGPPGRDLEALVASMQQILAQASVPSPVPSNLRPALSAARDHAVPYDHGCVNVGVVQRLNPCEFGVAGAARTILLYGDSHAVHWFEPLQEIAVQRGYRLVVLTKGGCPVVDVVVPTPVLRRTCPPYRDGVIEWIAQHRPAVVVAANAYTQYGHDAPTWAAGAEVTMARLAAVAAHLVVVGDIPVSRTDPPACLSGHRDDVTACATARADAVRTDRLDGEAAAARAHGATFVDVTDWFCTPTTCPAVIGDLLVRRDATHLTPPMATFLTPLLDAAMAPVLDAAG